MTGNRSGTERALIGTDVTGVPVILATDGPWVKAAVEATSASAEECGVVGVRECGEPGLYLWTGTGQLETWGPDFNEPEAVFDGEVRKLTAADDLAALYAMTPPRTCVMCGQPAASDYSEDESLPSCGRAACELRIQGGMDYHAEAGDR
jgi:hypothetical protein